jgi:hypothetical protein
LDKCLRQSISRSCNFSTNVFKQASSVSTLLYLIDDEHFLGYVIVIRNLSSCPTWGLIVHLTLNVGNRALKNISQVLIALFKVKTCLVDACLQIIFEAILKAGIEVFGQMYRIPS